MERITIHVSSKEKANLLLEFLRSVEFIQDIQTESIASVPNGDFFDLAGIWEDRDIGQVSLRKRAYLRSNSPTDRISP